jgi:hypothetical protein
MLDILKNRPYKGYKRKQLIPGVKGPQGCQGPQGTSFHIDFEEVIRKLKGLFSNVK